MSNQISESAQKQQLVKAFKLLKSHACKVANFTLQWQDLEDHLRFIHSQIESKLQQNTVKYQPQIDTNKQNDPNPQTKHLVSSQNNSPAKINKKGYTETEKISSVPVKNGKELLLYVKELGRDVGDRLCHLFKAVDDPGKLVLEALREFYPPGFSKGEVVSNKIRLSCVVLLEQFERVRDRVEPQVREEAMRLAVEWKRRVENSLEVLGFLQLIISFGLVGEFASDEIYKLFNNVFSRRQAPKLLKALGFANKASEIIQKLIKMDRRLEAVRFIFEFDLVNEFPPVPLLKAHAKHAKKVAKRIRRKGNNSSKAQDNAAKNEIDALKGILRFIENYQLGYQYSSKNLMSHIQQLEKQRKESKEIAKATVSNAESQPKKGNKRAAPAPKSQLNQQNMKKQLQTAAADASVTSQAIHSEQPSHSQPASSFAAQSAKYSTLSAGIDAPSITAPYPYHGAASNIRPIQPSCDQPSQAIHSEQPSNHQPANSFPGQGAKCSTRSAGLDAPSFTAPYPHGGAASNIQSIWPFRDQPSQAIHSAQSCDCQPPSLFAFQGAKYSTPSAVLDAASITAPYPSGSAASNIQSVEPSCDQLSGLLTGAEFLAPSAGNNHIAVLDAQVSAVIDVLSKAISYPCAGAGSYSQLIRSPHGRPAGTLTGAQQLTPSLRNYLSTGSTPVTSYTSLTAGPYGLAGSASVHPHMSSSPGLDERTSAAIESSRQFGFARTNTHTGVASNANGNVSVPYYQRELPGTSMYFSRQAPSSSTGMAPNKSPKTSGSYSGPVYNGFSLK